MRRRGGDRMRRRQVIALLGSVAITWPAALLAQQLERTRRLGLLLGFSEADAESQQRVKIFRQGLESLGWSEGRNLIIDFRFADGSEIPRMPGYAQELVSLSPDLIFAHSNPALAAVMEATR